MAVMDRFRDFGSVAAMTGQPVIEYTPECIEHLREGEVFVFGSNREGIHAGGAARTAVEKFGAVMGVGEGPQGRSYGIPTMGSEHEMAEAVKTFLVYARANSGTRFYVTRIGCGIAGHGPEYAAPYFAGAPGNVVLPRDFAAILEGENQ